MRLFALDGSEALGTATARALKKRLDPHEERDFEDGEHKARPLVSSWRPVVKTAPSGSPPSSPISPTVGRGHISRRWRLRGDLFAPPGCALT